jgi:hypothetical protein
MQAAAWDYRLTLFDYPLVARDEARLLSKIFVRTSRREIFEYSVLSNRAAVFTN